MVKLNDKTEITKKIIHIMITEKCDRNCPYCCNKQYDLSTIEKVTDEELREAEMVFLTGGEPFAYFEDPCAYAMHLKMHFSNIKKVIIYTNAYELMVYLKNGGKIYCIDGLTISVKNKNDLEAIKWLVDLDIINSLSSIRTYIFNDFDVKVPRHWHPFKRKWQKEFAPAPDSIFRRL